ncbi:hypothetical protein GCM10022256_23680 [Frondihabitans peucedani]|uniref:Uncharacterized protein n=2 Tax=Frondihabitans peucedani TaxID=598626 RepID=A0ABP8E3R0_9MICO
MEAGGHGSAAAAAAAASHDDDFRARFQAAFHAAGGEGDAFDELLARVPAAGFPPAGAADPALERAALAEAAFSGVGSDQDARASAARLAAFDARRRQQSRALDAALAATPLVAPPESPELPASPEPPASPVSPEPLGAAAAYAPTPAPTRAPASAVARPQRAPLRFARRHPVALTAAALVAAVVLGAALGRATTSRPAADSPPSSASSAVSTPDPGATAFTEFGGSVLARAINRVQVPTDALPDGLRDAVSPPSSRLLYDDSPSSQPSQHRWRLWAGTGENPRQLCYVMSFDGVRDSVSCLPRAEAFVGRYVVSESTPDGVFTALVVDGAIAVQID